ncbi:MAG TPA: hypothetical protein ENJ95_12160 [Bacteroidetes bacterium]|nr:hypothetical protein [Bacteroidota bacterium]
MKKYFLLLLVAPLLFTACSKDNEVLPEADAVMIKFVNKTGYDIEGLAISRVFVGDLKKNKTSSEYHRYDALGQQYGYALVEAVGEIDNRRYFTASACQGICGTPSAPHGLWLENGYYKIAIRIAPNEQRSLEFKMMN